MDRASGIKNSDSRSICLEARRKFEPIIIEARKLFGEDQETARLQFAAFRQANPDLFTFQAEGVSVEHIDVWKLDADDPHRQVFIWAWLGDVGAIGYSDGHVENTENRGLFDRVVSAGRGLLHSQKLIYIEGGIERTELIPAGPIE